MSVNLARKLELAILSTIGIITGANKIMKTLYGVAKNILFTFDRLKAKMDYLVLDGFPVGVLIESQKWKG